MAEISKITLSNGTTYDVKDSAAMSYPYIRPIETKTYTNVIGTENSNRYAGFFYLKVRGTTYNTRWHVKVRVRATVPSGTSAELYNTDSVFDFWATQNTYCGWSSTNRILSTSYRPIYYHSHFRVSSTGYTNGCGSWIGFNLTSSTNPIDTALKRTIVVDLLEYNDCTVEMQDTLITPDNIPSRASNTGWYSSSNTSYDNFDAATNGFKSSGDANTTNISNLYYSNGTYIADSALYRYQLLFQKDSDTLTPLNNANNVTGTTKTMLTDVEFDPFELIGYYYSTTTINAGANISAGSIFYQMSGLDLRYTLNCGTTLTAQKPLYLVVTPTSNYKCKIASTTPWAQTLPEENDGNWYILLGRTYSTYQMALYPNHPIYAHDGTKVRRIYPQSALATNGIAGLMSPTDKAKVDAISPIASSEINAIFSSL